jgi:hypothetical protein
MRRRVRRMSKQPGDAEFAVDDQRVQDLAASLGQAVPAALLAPVWRAMLEAGVVVAPVRVAVDRAELVLIDPNTLELRVPISTTRGQLVKSVTVYVDQWPAAGELASQVADAAERLARALETADANSTFSYSPGQGQKPHN